MTQKALYLAVHRILGAAFKWGLPARRTAFGQWLTQLKPWDSYHSSCPLFFLVAMSDFYMFWLLKDVVHIAVKHEMY